MNRRHYRLFAASLVGVLAACGGDDNDDNDGTGLTVNQDVLVDVCRNLCDRVASCIPLVTEMDRLECRAGCDQSIQAAPPEQVTQDCLQKSTAALQCYTNASCNDLLTTCAAAAAAAQAACPQDTATPMTPVTNPGLVCPGLDCAACGESLGATCDGLAESCAAQPANGQCCMTLQMTYGRCASVAACTYDCSKCSNSVLRAACESGKDTCRIAPTDTDYQQCCTNFAALYDTQCM